MTVSFERRASEDLVVRDAVERRRYVLETSGRTDPTTVQTDRFTFPVDAAVAIETSAVTLPTVVATYVRTADGEMVAEAEHLAYQELPAGAYSIELCAPVKLYLRVESPLTVSADSEQLSVTFPGSTTVLVGARSHHEQPAGTVTTTDDPEDVMRAVSTFGSALKTTSPERSYPTLRGHPPTVERGDALSIPDAIDPPTTGIRIEVPPDLEHVYPVAPLAYYLGARVVPAERPALVTDGGFVHPLELPGQDAGFERAVERALKQTFLLDCVTRTEGLYQVDLHERRAIADVVDLDFQTLYDRPIAQRVATYLSEPYEAVADQVPEWKLTTHVAPTADNVEMLPFVVDDLAVVKTPAASPAAAPAPAAAAIDDFVRSATDADTTTPSLVEPERTGSLEQAWVGRQAPLGASKAIPAAFRNKLDRTATDDDPTIAVVCNDERMRAEQTAAGEVYGSRAALPFEVDSRSQLAVSELRALLRSDIDFLHYVGHIDDDGFACADGTLDAGTLDAVSVDAFVLNACTSYDQGLSLVEAGAIGGVVTVTDVVDDEAVEIGKSMAKLLTRGFPLRAALNIAGERSLVGDQYMVVGDGNVDIAQAEGFTALVVELETTADGYRLAHRTYVVANGGMGSMYRVNLEDNDSHQLTAGSRPAKRMTEDQVRSFLEGEVVPVVWDGEFCWSDEVLAAL